MYVQGYLDETNVDFAKLGPPYTTFRIRGRPSNIFIDGTRDLESEVGYLWHGYSDNA
jgi:hypothetical protein